MFNINYLHDLYAGVDLPATPTKNYVQKKLDVAFSQEDSPWRIVIG